MRHRHAVLAVGLALSLAGCSSVFGPGTDVGTTETPTGVQPDAAAIGTPTETGTNERNADTDDSSNRTTASLRRVELELRTTTMGSPPTVVNGTVSPGDDRAQIVRTVDDNRTTGTVSLPANWSSRLVGNLDDRQLSAPGTATVTDDYDQTLGLTLVFPNTTVEITVDTAAGLPDRLPVTVGNRTYYSDDPELRAVVFSLYSSLSQARYELPATESEDRSAASPVSSHETTVRQRRSGRTGRGDTGAPATVRGDRRPATHRPRPGSRHADVPG